MAPSKTIVFNVIASKKIGLGHIYRAIAMVRLLQPDFNSIIFCKRSHYDYCLKIFPKYKKIKSYTNQENFFEQLEKIGPSLVINDMLSTSKHYMGKLKSKKYPIINFEDLGSGSDLANLVLNELYDSALNTNSNTLWGHKYYLLRDEFLNKRPPIFKKKVTGILITFGGTDQNNFSLLALNQVIKLSRLKQLKIYVVIGAGYSYFKDLKKTIREYQKNGSDIELIFHTGKMSQIMNKCQIGIASNGRTVYELCYMRIPSIILSHHKRELGHSFADPHRGFIPVGLYQKGTTEKKIRDNIKKLVLDNTFRKQLYSNNAKVKFHQNKKKLRQLILEIIENEVH